MAGKGNAELAEQVQIVPAFMPVDMSSAANTGDWVSLKNYEGVLIVLASSVGTAGDDAVITLAQATAVAGTGTKDLTFTRLREKTGATAINAVGQFTLVTQTAATSYDSAATDGAENQQIITIDVKAEDLDVDGGFDCVQASVADVGTNAQLGTCLYILYGPRNSQETLASAIAD